MGLYVHPRWRRNPVGAKAALRLINGIKKWSDARNVSHISIHTTAGILSIVQSIGMEKQTSFICFSITSFCKKIGKYSTQKTDKLLRRLGFVTLGGNYVG